MKFLSLLVSVILIVAIHGEEPEEHEHYHQEGHVTRRVLDNGHRVLLHGTKITCKNKYRANPCGPEAVCEDIEGGISCTSGWTNGCPPGCDSHSDCVKNEHGIYSCVCHEGYEKPSELSLSCMTKEEVFDYQEWQKELALESAQ
jgi:hypothetical protein